MIIKQAFLGVFHRFMAFCIAMTMFVFTAHATIPSEYVQIIPDDTTQYPETLTGYTINMLNNGYFNSALAGDDGYPGYVRRSLSSSNITVSGTGVYTAFVQGVPARSNSVNGINIYAYQGKTTYIRLRYIGTDMWGNDVNITTTSLANNYFSSTPTPVLYKITTTTNNVHVAAKRISDGVFGYYCTSGDCIATNNNTQVKFIPVYGMTGTVNPCPGGTMQTYTTVASTDVPVGVQNGTPTPTNPITPTFYTQGNMILRKVGNIADSYDASTGKITRRVAVVVFDGTESWAAKTPGWEHNLQDAKTGTDGLMLSHFGFLQSGGWADVPVYYAKRSGTIFRINYPEATTAAELKSWLAAQYNAGTPVTVWYPLAEPVEETWTEESYCRPNIKIATRAYNTTQFAPVVTALNSAIDTIKDVVTNTINQTAAVSALQSTKQTRPDEECPAGKKCLLVEDVDGTPHWYEIIENIYGLPSGYTPLEYIESTGTQYIDTGAVYKSSRIYNVDFQYVAYPDGAKGSLGARETSTAGEGTFDIGCNSTVFYFYNNSTPANKREPRDLARHTVEIDYTNSVFKFDGETLPWTTGTGAWQGTYNIYIGRENIAGSPNTSVGTVKWYSYKVYDNGTLVQDLVPAKNASGVIGMYDLADPNPATAFHTNAGTGTFTAGPEI